MPIYRIGKYRRRLWIELKGPLPPDEDDFHSRADEGFCAFGWLLGAEWEALCYGSCYSQEDKAGDCCPDD